MSLNKLTHVIATFLCFIIVFSSLLVPFIISGAIYQIPMDDDELGHELLAANVARGKGFGMWIDSEILEPFIKFAENTHDNKNASTAKYIAYGGYKKQLNINGTSEITTFRPPLYIYSLALVYKIFGRHFIYYRLLNAFFIALGATILFFTLSKLGYIWPAIVSTVIISSDVFLMRVTLFALTESLSYFLISILFSLILFLPRQKDKWHSIMIGTVSGLLILTRPVFAFCLPFVWLLIAIPHYYNFKINNTITYTIKACLVCCIIITPWCFRNMQLLKAPMPLGSQGPTVLGMIYSDGIIERYGNWTDKINTEYYQNYTGDEEGLERERALALRGSNIFKSWLKEHYDLLPQIMFLRVISLWWVHAAWCQRTLVILSLIALCIFKDKRIRFASICLFVSYSFAIALTTNNENGRYLMAIYPVMHVLSGMVIGEFSLWMLRIYQQIKKSRTSLNRAS